MVTCIWIGIVAVSVLYGAATGRIGEVGQAALEGAASAVNICLSMLAPMCLWSGLTELLSELGVMRLLNRMLSPLAGRLFPKLSRDGEGYLVSCSMAANMLGLGNAATPLTLKASAALGKYCRGQTASKELCRFIVLNTASIQLLPMTVCSIRAGLGAENPFDIVPAVWIASAFALAMGLGAMFIFEKIWGRREI